MKQRLFPDSLRQEMHIPLQKDFNLDHSPSKGLLFLWSQATQKSVYSKVVVDMCICGHAKTSVCQHCSSRGCSTQHRHSEKTIEQNIRWIRTAYLLKSRSDGGLSVTLPCQPSTTETYIQLEQPIPQFDGSRRTVRKSSSYEWSE